MSYGIDGLRIADTSDGTNWMNDQILTREGASAPLAERAMYFDYSCSFGNYTGGHDVVGYRGG